MIYTKESEDLSFKESEPSFDYDLQSYYVIGPLGRGACGFVYRIENFKTKKQFALKVIDKKEKNYNHIEKRLRKEIKIQQELDHPNIIRLIKHFEDEQNYYLLMELGLNGELQGLLKERGKLNEKEIVDITFQLASGLKYLHDKDIIHRDLKLQNILLSGETIKIADFGLSTKVSDDSPECFSLCGTPNYISPEIVNSQSYGKKTDIWSFGCILYALCTGSPPFMGDSVIKTIQNVKDGSLKLPNTISANLKDLLLNTINWDSSSRFSIEQVIQHQFYSEKYAKSIITFDSAESKKLLSEEGKLPLKVLPFDWTSPRFSIIPAYEKQLEQHRNNCSPSNKENISSFCNIISQKQQQQQTNNKLSSTATLKSLSVQNNTNKYQNTYVNNNNSQVFSMTARSIRTANHEKQDTIKSHNSKSTQRLVNYLSSSQTGRQVSVSPQSRQNQSSISYQPTPVTSKEKHYQSASISSNKDTKQHLNSTQIKDKTYLGSAVSRQEKQPQNNNNNNIKSSRSVSYLDSNRVPGQTVTSMRQPLNKMQSSISQHSVSIKHDNNNKHTGYQQYSPIQSQNKSQQLISSLGQENKTNRGYLMNNNSYSNYDNINTPLNGYSSLNNTARQSKLMQKQQQQQSQRQQQFTECLMKRHASEIIPVNKNQISDNKDNGQNSMEISSQKEMTKNHRSKSRSNDYQEDHRSPKKSSKSARNSIISDEQQIQLEGVKSETNLHRQPTYHASSKSFSHNINVSRNIPTDNQWDRLNQPSNTTNHESHKRSSVRDQSPIDLGSEDLPEGTTTTTSQGHNSNGLLKNEPNCNNTSPLSTKYLKPNRVATKNGFIEIQEDRWLSIECQNGSLIFKISPDGINIQIEKYIKNKCSRKDYSLYSLPAKYVQLYEYAKVVCTTLKSKIPLVKITNDHGTFMLMRNKPKQNYEVQLLNGCRVSHAIGTDKMFVKDGQGKEYQIHLIEHQSNVVYPQEVTQAVKLSLEYLTECLQKQNQKYLASFN